jgi:hypothetical protein
MIGTERAELQPVAVWNQTKRHFAGNVVGASPVPVMILANKESKKSGKS